MCRRECIAYAYVRVTLSDLQVLVPVHRARGPGVGGAEALQQQQQLGQAGQWPGEGSTEQEPAPVHQPRLQREERDHLRHLRGGGGEGRRGEEEERGGEER